jgi:hypothetical protein
VERLRYLRHRRKKEEPTVASLISLQGNGGGRIPMGGFSYAVSRRDLTQIIACMPTDRCRQMHIAARAGDTATAQRLIREAATAYYASAPAAPAAPPLAPCISTVPTKEPTRRQPRTQPYVS